MINADSIPIHAVLHTLDWQRALANLTKTIAVIQNKSLSREGKKTIFTDIKDFLMYVLALMSAILDVILSVAASVVFSRLLISGDVESNPGPGECVLPVGKELYCYVNSVINTDLDYNRVDANQILGNNIIIVSSALMHYFSIIYGR